MPPNPRVLVVDGDIDVRILLGLILSAAGFTVFTAANGQEGLRAARLARPSVIILDLMMPGMDGLEFRQQQRGDPKLSGIPVVVTSAVDNLHRCAHALDAVTLVPKPFDLDALIRAVSEASQLT